jgi:hypothetical protein
MKYDIRLIRLSDKSVNLKDYTNLVDYSLDQRFAMGSELVPLAQAFISNLLIEKGSDRLEPERGGGLITFARRYNRVSDELEERVRTAISSVELFMRSEQASRTMEPQERLHSARLIAVTPGASPDEIQIEILLQAESGDVLQLTL